MPGITYAQQFEPIDSVFFSSLPDFSGNIEKVTDSIWPDMKIPSYLKCCQVYPKSSNKT